MNRSDNNEKTTRPLDSETKRAGEEETASATSEKERESENAQASGGEQTTADEQTTDRNTRAESGDDQNGAKSASNESDSVRPLTWHDGILAIFYLIVLFVGITLCLSHGQSATVFHVLTVTIALVGITVLKFSKYSGSLRSHIVELGLLCALSVCSIVALAAWVLPYLI